MLRELKAEEAGKVEMPLFFGFRLSCCVAALAMHKPKRHAQYVNRAASTAG
jgi:hypothetical protein